jgi:hypothetical protein
MGAFVRRDVAEIAEQQSDLSLSAQIFGPHPLQLFLSTRLSNPSRRLLLQALQWVFH